MGRLEIVYKTTEELTPYLNNPRKNDRAVKFVAESIRQFGFKIPVVIDRNGVIVAGHTRVKAAKKLGITDVPCIIADDLTDEQVNAFRLADNKVAEMSSWDSDLLATELSLIGMDMTAFGFDESDEQKRERAKGTLKERFIVAPFSVLDARDGDWQKRKTAWRELISSREGRSDDLLGDGLNRLVKQMGGNTTLTGTSEFDPVLTEVLVNWFCPLGGKIIDPFAGGSVRGLVSSFLGAKYTGIDLRQEQIDANAADYKRNTDLVDITGRPISKPTWICGDSTECKALAPGDYDFLLTCPPYADPEVYSDDPRDLSNMDYEGFRTAYTNIIRNATSMLSPDRFAAVVVGEVRGSDGAYNNLVSDTIAAFRAAGLAYYDEFVLVTIVGTLAYRVTPGFEASRKVGKDHQNVLLFCKGDPKSASRIADGEVFTSKQPAQAHEKVLVFTKGNAKKATKKLEKYDYVF